MAMQIKPLWALGAALLGLAAQAQAQQGAPEDPTLKKTGDSVTEPFDGKEVPDKLLAIQADPYSLAGLRRCAAIIREVEELDAVLGPDVNERRSEEHTSELQSLMRISYAVFCLKKKKYEQTYTIHNQTNNLDEPTHNYNKI